MEDADELRLARRIFFDDEAGCRRMCRVVEQEPDRKETPAQFQERCAQLALELLWRTELAGLEAVAPAANRKRGVVRHSWFDGSRQPMTVG